MSVHYEQINNMLLNEFLKAHKKIEELRAIATQQQKGMEILTAQLKEQAAQIQKSERAARDEQASSESSGEQTLVLFITTTEL